MRLVFSFREGCCLEGEKLIMLFRDAVPWIEPGMWWDWASRGVRPLAFILSRDECGFDRLGRRKGIKKFCPVGRWGGGGLDWSAGIFGRQ